MVSSRGTLVKSKEISYDTKMSPLLICNLRISSANSKVSVIVYGYRTKAVVSPLTILPIHSCTFVWQISWGA